VDGEEGTGGAEGEAAAEEEEEEEKEEEEEEEEGREFAAPNGQSSDSVLTLTARVSAGAAAAKAALRPQRQQQQQLCQWNARQLVQAAACSCDRAGWLFVVRAAHLSNTRPCVRLSARASPAGALAGPAAAAAAAAKSGRAGVAAAAPADSVPRKQQAKAAQSLENERACASWASCVCVLGERLSVAAAVAVLPPSSKISRQILYRFAALTPIPCVRAPYPATTQRCPQVP